MLFPTGLIFVVSIVSILLVIGTIYSGYKVGFVTKLIEFFSTLICIILAWFLSNIISDEIAIMPKEYVSISGTSIDEVFYHAVNEILVFLILFIIFRILIIFIRPIFKKINWIPLVGLVNKIGGAFMGALQAFLILVMMCIILSSPLFINGNQVLKESKLVYVNNIAKSILSTISNRYNEMESIQKMQSSSEVMEDQDIQNIRDWLEQYEFDDSEQDDIINAIKQRNE